MIGRTLSHYRILRELGRGAMGEVYVAEDVHLGRHVAIKLLPSDLCCDAEATDRFTREARIVSSLNHPNICTLYDFGRHEGRSFMVMELLEGEPLSMRIARGPLPIDDVLAYGAGVAAALDVAHCQGVIHQDIKPANLFITSRGEIKVLDFGVARLAKATGPLDTTRGGTEPVTTLGTAAGTVAYMSPEQARGEPTDGRSDLFSLGIVLYEAATGRPPFQGKTAAAIFEGLLTQSPTPASALRTDLPVELDRILTRLLEKNPALRPQSAAHLLADMEQLRRQWRHPGTIEAPPARQGRRERGRWWWLAAPALSATAVAVVMAWQVTRTPALEPRDSIVLADLVNRTGDADFDDTLGEALAVQLRQSPFLNVVSESRVQMALALMQRPPDTRLADEVGREVCQRVHARALLTSAIANLGRSYVLTLGAADCVTGDTLAERQTEASRKEDVLRQLGTMASAFREQLGESLASIERYDAPIEEATTSSLDALRAYSQAMVARRIHGDRAALPLLRRAVELDPRFALAHARLGTVSGNLGDIEASRRHTTRSFELRDRVSQRERLYIEARYHTEVRPSPARAIEAYRIAIATFPFDYASRVNLALLLSDRSEYDEAIVLLHEAAALAPDEPIARTNLADVLVAAGRFDEARQEAERARAMRDDGWSRAPLLAVAVLTKDVELETEQRSWIAAHDTEGLVLPTLWHAALYRGQLRESERLLVEMTRRFGPQGLPGLVAEYQVNTALALAAVRSAEHAERWLSGMPGNAPVDDPARQRVLAAALLRDAAAARRWLPLALGRLPEGPEGQPQAATLMALAQATEGDRERALATLGPVQHHAHDAQRVLVHGLLSVDAARWDEAIRDFVWYRDSRHGHLEVMAGVVRFHLAAAYEGAGSPDEARRAYAEFLEFWRTADPDLPLIVEARRALARLGS